MKKKPKQKSRAVKVPPPEGGVKKLQKKSAPKPSKRRTIKCVNWHVTSAIENHLKSLSLIEDNEFVIAYTQSTDLKEVEILLGREVKEFS